MAMQQLPLTSKPGFSRLRWVVVGLCSVVILISVFNLIGWWTGKPLLVSFFPKLVTMKPNTALSVLLLALSALTKQSTGLGKYLGDLFCAVALMFAFGTLWEYASGHNIGIDQLLAYVPPEQAGDPAGRMSFGTALDTGFSACGLLLLDSAPWLSLACSVVAGLISLSAVVGFLFNASPMLAVPMLQSMSLRTAFSLASIQLVTMLIRPLREPTRSLLRTVAFHQTSVWFLIGTCTLPLILGWPIAYLYRLRAFDATFAFAVLVVLLMSIQAVLVSRNSRSLARVEDKRDFAENERRMIAEEQQRTNADLVASEKRAAKSEAQYRLITDALPAYISYLDTDLRYVRVNRTYLEWFGKTADQIEGKLLDDVLGESTKNVRGHLETALAGTPQHFETRMQSVQGERILSVSHIPDVDPGGRIRGVIVMGHDVTARRHAELELRNSEERFRALSQHSPLGIFQADLNSRITYVNPQILKTFGRTEKELLGLQWLHHINPADLHRLSDDWPIAIAENRPFQAEYRIFMPDGQERTVYGRSVMVLDEHGQPSSVVGTLDDVTVRRQSETALRQTEKLAAVGKLASSIAHEINNPLESVTNLLYLAQTSENLTDIHHHLEIAEQELRRVSAIANQTLRFHRQATRPIAVRPEELLETVLGVYQGRLLNSKVVVSERLRATRSITCLDGEIRQVLNNLVGNAIDAMHGSGGTLYLRSRDATHPKSGAPGILFTIADTGAGMSQATLGKIFEAFFTTKGVSGTGLGLWVSHEIIERHHGTMKVRSSDRKMTSGTLFSLFLPSESSVTPAPILKPMLDGQ